MRVLNAAQMREADRRTIQEVGVPSLVLMENAGREVVAAIERVHGDRLDQPIAVFCGRGNNGGDGFVVARRLLERGARVSVFLIGSRRDMRGDARANLEALVSLGFSVVEIADGEAWKLHSPALTGCGLIVDAIFGTGLAAPLSGLVEVIVADINRTGVPVVSIDLPSGLSADSHKPNGSSVEADLTVALAAPKLSLVLPPADKRAGKLVVADIGIPASVIEALDGPRIHLLTPRDVCDLVAPRLADSHKGDYGHVLIVAGSPGKTGAAHLAALGALRSGAGLVTVATPATCQPTVAAMAPEYMTEPIAEISGEIDPKAVDRLLEGPYDVIGIGPGLGQKPATRKFVKAIVDRAATPLVVDADGLNAFADDPDRLTGRAGRSLVLTPHPGELGRLARRSSAEVQTNRLESARAFATAHHAYVVLKGHRTLLASPDDRVFINPTGNPGMATGGTGDVLTGMVAGWLAQLRDAEAACKLAVYLHGLAGDLAAAEKGQIAMIARDLVEQLGNAVKELTGE
jgi:NAD(P)H-hydrate epimerase